jgi:hypothetical protein
MNYYVIVYDRAEGELLKLEPFAASVPALTRRFNLEREMRDQGDIEIVVLSAESEEALLATHARYFRSLGELSEATG